MLHVHADEATAAREVGQQVVAVARGDEVGDARQGFGVVLEGPAQGDAFQLHQVLEQRHPFGRKAVEFVDVDEAEGRQLVLGGSRIIQVKVFGEVHLQGRWHQLFYHGLPIGCNAFVKKQLGFHFSYGTSFNGCRVGDDGVQIFFFIIYLIEYA